MQTVQLKYDIIAWLTGLNDEKTLNKLHKLMAKEQKTTEISMEGMVPPRRKGSLIEGYGFWENDATFDEAKEYEQLKTIFFNSSKNSMAQQISKYVS